MSFDAKLQQLSGVVSFLFLWLSFQPRANIIEGTQPVMPIGYVAHSTPATVPTAVSTKLIPSTSQPPHVVPGWQYKFNAINIVAPLNPHSMLPFLNTKNTPLVKPRYQEAHCLYDEMRKHIANKAYTTSANTEVVVVKIWMMTHVPTKKNPPYCFGKLLLIILLFNALMHVSC